jgi:hypothetical protein
MIQNLEISIMFASTSLRNEGKYVLFVGGKLIGIVASEGDAINFPMKGSKFAYYIGDDQPAIRQF